MYEKEIHSDGSCGYCGWNQYAEIRDTDSGFIVGSYCTKCQEEKMKLFLLGELEEDEDIDEEEYYCANCSVVEVEEEGCICDECREEDED